MLEFAFVAPLVLIVAIYSADTMRILRTEQQLEIATRLAADVEAHMANYYGNGKTPSSATKNVAKRYLVDVAHVVENVGDVYIKGDSYVVKNLLSVAVDWINRFMKGQAFGDDNLFLKMIGKILGGIMNFVTFSYRCRPPRPGREDLDGRVHTDHLTVCRVCRDFPAETRRRRRGQDRRRAVHAGSRGRQGGDCVESQA